MKQKSMLFLSAGINLVLVAYFVFGVSRPVPQGNNQPKWSPRATEAKVSADQVPDVEVPGTEVIPEQSPTFRWNQIESQDYTQYIRNLRSVGCPEATIRDIVEADINELFEPRYHQLLQSVQSFDYWRQGPNDLANQESLRQELVGVDQERLGYLRELLGESYSPGTTLAGLSHQDLVARSSIGFLSPEQQSAVAEIKQESQDAERALRVEFSGRENREALKEALAENKRAQRARLEALLGAEDLLELDLRDSHVASSLRNKLRGFEVSESEFREMFAQRQAYEMEQGEVPDYTNPEAVAERNTARQALEASYRETLGENRYTDLQRIGDADWRALRELETSDGLSREVMGQAYDLRKEASQSLMLATSNSELDEVEREALVAAARAQYQREMTALIGEDGYDAMGDLPQQRSLRISTFRNGGEASVMMLGGVSNEAFGLAEGIVDTILPQGANLGASQIETRIIAVDQPADLILDTRLPSPTPAP